MEEKKNQTPGELIPAYTTDEAKKARILVADDDKLYQEIYRDLIAEAGHESLVVDNGLELLEKVSNYRPDIIISDVVMPGMDGFELVSRLKADPLTMHIPVIIVTSLADRASKVTGLDRGADELLNKPIDEAEFGIRITNLLKVKRFEDYLLAHGKMLEGEVQTKSVQLEKAYEKIKHGYIETVYRLTIAAEYRDKETGGHIRRISLYSQLLARFLGLAETEVEAIFFASPMHDVGKIGIPDSILLKPGKHTGNEFEVMKTHTLIGAEILRDSDSDILKAAKEVALNHHERWDGLGYPYGTKGEAIPISGRIVNIVDIYDALRSARPYKEPFDHESSCAIISGMDARFDPTVYNAFKECAGEFKRLFDENQQESYKEVL
jgi:putative two-component system response regulator